MLSGFEFAARCACCGGELSVLTRTQPDDITTSARVVCRLCGKQFVIDVFMNPAVHWSQEMARLNAGHGLVSESPDGRR